MPIHHTRWQHRALYNNTNHTHTHTHTHTASDEGMGRAVKNSLEIIIIKQVRLEGGFKRGGRIRVGIYNGNSDSAAICLWLDDLCLALT